MYILSKSQQLECFK